MKNLLFLGFMLGSFHSFAQQGVTVLNDGDMALSPIKKAQIVAIRSICPPNPNGIACMAIGSFVVVEFALKGCMDNITNVFTNFYYDRNRRPTLAVGALNVHNEASKRVRCIEMPRKRIQVSIPHEGNIQLKILQSVEAIRPLH